MKNILTQHQINNIKELCTENNIESFSINNDGTIDVQKNVTITKSIDGKLPLRFNNVKGFFKCMDIGLTTLEGSPKRVLSTFNCSTNHLSSLEYGPEYVGGSYFCYKNKLTSLKGAPQEGVDIFNCGSNKITSLEHAPSEVYFSLTCSLNNISTLKGCPILNEPPLMKGNPLPRIVFDELLYFDPEADFDQEKIDTINKFVKFQDHFDVWENGFNEEGFKELLQEIKEGLE